MNKESKDQILTMATVEAMHLAVELANSIRTDVEYSGEISLQTLSLVDAFEVKCDELNGLLDLSNSLN